MRIISIVRITPLPEKRLEFLSILRSIMGPTLAMRDCLDCRILEDDGDAGEIVFLEDWKSWEAFMRHLRSEIYTRMLEAMELSRLKPEISFFEVSATHGMALIKAIRNQQS